jgi:8-oxo-dGTP pyrophosphatase MutT (NUDIX family)
VAAQIGRAEPKIGGSTPFEGALKMVKTKWEFSAGGIVFKKENDEVLWLIIQPEGDSHWSKNRWQFPKGVIETGEKAQETAEREIEEETGVKARAIQKIDDLRIFFYDEEKNRIVKTISLFLMSYEGEGKREEDQEKIAEITWLSFKEASEKLTFETEKKALEKAKKILEQ